MSPASEAGTFRGGLVRIEPSPVERARAAIMRSPKWLGKVLVGCEQRRFVILVFVAMAIVGSNALL